MLDNINISIDFIKIGWGLVIPLFLFRMFYMIFGFNLELFFYLIKSIGYLAIAWLIWSLTKHQKEINLITAFTFILSCYEGVDSLSRVIEIPFNYFKKIVLHFRNRNI